MLFTRSIQFEIGISIIFLSIMVFGCTRSVQQEITLTADAPTIVLTSAPIAISKTPGSILTREAPAGQTPTVLPTNIGVPTLTPLHAATSTVRVEGEAPYPICQEFPSPLPGNFSIDGAIVYKDIAQGVYASLGGNPVIESQLPLPGEEHDFWQTYTRDFSPEGGWLAFVYSSGEHFTSGPPFKQNRFGLLSAHGNIIEHELDFASLEARIPEGSFLDSWLSARWINQDLILTSFAYRFPDEPPSPFPVVSILDPFQGVWLQELLDSLPDADLTIAPAFSPDLRRVLYLRDSGEQALLNRETNAVLWTGSAHYFTRTTRLLAIWSSDNSMLALKVWEDPDATIYDGGGILLMDREGGARTHVAKAIFEALPANSYWISNLSWSLNNQLLAFVVRQFNEVDFLQTIYVYDIAAKRIVYRCPLSPLEEASITFYWSPDSRYIAYTYFHISPVILLDIESREAFQLAENAILVGWSEQFPTDWLASE